MANGLAKLLPPHKIYVEVFGGAANLLLTKQPSRIEVYNDINGQLVNLFETVRNHPLLFIERCQHLLYSRQLYNTWKDQLAEDFNGADVDGVEAAVRTAYTITSSFTGDATKGWAFDRTGQGGANRWANIYDKIIYVSRRLQRVNIDHLDFRKCIEYWDTRETLFFLDPPYYERNSPRFYQFNRRDHKDLREILQHVKAKWILTYDNCDRIHEFYKRFNIRPISSALSGQKVAIGDGRKRLPQLLITNFSVNN
jgi:DNA adenine methylase